MTLNFQIRYYISLNPLYSISCVAETKIFTVILETSFQSHHTVATSSGLRENVKLNNIYRILTKDCTDEMGE